jgi:hypothetical protein
MHPVKGFLKLGRSGINLPDTSIIIAIGDRSDLFVQGISMSSQRQPHSAMTMRCQRLPSPQGDHEQYGDSRNR